MTENWRVRFRITDSELVGVRLKGWIKSDDDVCRENGFDSASHYWSVALSEPMVAIGFANFIASYFHTPYRSDDHMLTTIGLKAAVREAWASGESWVFPNRAYQGVEVGKLESMMVRPDAAVAWIASKPLRRHLLPPSLREYLEPKAAPPAGVGVAKAEHEPRARGRPPALKREIVEKMKTEIVSGEISARDLKAMAEKALAARYSASRDTCRLARDIALSENVGKH